MGFFDTQDSDSKDYILTNTLLSAAAALSKANQPRYSNVPIAQPSTMDMILQGMLGAYSGNVGAKQSLLEQAKTQQETQLKKQEVIKNTLANQQAIDSANFWRGVHGQQPVSAPTAGTTAATPEKQQWSLSNALLDAIGLGDEEKKTEPTQATPTATTNPSTTDQNAPYGIPTEVWSFNKPPTREQAMKMSNLMMTYGAGDDRTKEMIGGLQKYGRGELGYDFGNTWDAPVTPIKGGTNDPAFIQRKSAAEASGKQSVEGPAIRTMNQGAEELSVIYDPTKGQYVPISRGPRWNQVFVDPGTGAYSGTGSPGAGVPSPTGSGTGGVANNNPGNIKGKFWGAASVDDRGFAIYSTPEQGVRAVESQIGLDARRGHTVESFITKYAPPSENDTARYIARVGQATGLKPGDKLPTDPAVVAKIRDAIIQVETGGTPSGGGGGVARPSGGAVPQEVFKQNIEIEKNYRNDFGTNKTVQNFMNVVHPAVTRGVAALNNPSPVSDVDAVYALVTVLDPNSVVREGEYSTMVNSQSIPDSLRGRLMKAVSGDTALSDDTRAEMKKLLVRSGNIHQDNYNRQYDQYSNMSKKRNIDPYNVVGDRLALALDQPKTETKPTVQPKVTEKVIGGVKYRVKEIPGQAPKLERWEGK